MVVGLGFRSCNFIVSFAIDVFIYVLTVTSSSLAFLLLMKWIVLARVVVKATNLGYIL